MSKKYEIDIFDIDQFKSFEKDLKELAKKIKSKDFMNFVADKCMLQLTKISNEKLGGFAEDDMAQNDVNNYRSNHKVEVQDDIIIIRNDTMADLSHVSQRTLENYPEGFSIAKAIEFGTGIYGSENDDPEWAVQVNEHRNYEKGWYYEKDGSLHWSKGFGGKFIYYELGQYVQENIADWVQEYFENE